MSPRGVELQTWKVIVPANYKGRLKSRIRYGFLFSDDLSVLALLLKANRVIGISIMVAMRFQTTSSCRQRQRRAAWL
ncbi:hypothetical protein [Neisseria sp. HMSC064E01]|uniref:hypothetical protein n=1 Tax=Neisseria sp. HMSC064E01 TaxID=1715052 RepID=UPI0011D1347E|nr:hypothetical protein [Neisseria sp. HMSC064E01]